MEKLSNQEKLRPWMGFVVQAGFLILFVSVGAHMQRTWGIPGLIASELMFAVVSVIYCLGRKVKLKEMFPIKPITLKDFFGTVFLGIAGFMFSMVGIGIALTVLPKSFRSEAVGLSDMLYGTMPYLVLVFVAALLPAICEETMERGCVLSHFRGVEKEWVVVLLMGLFFGIMHMSPLRFLSTATLGAILSYLMVKKNNILLPMILHFANNFVAASIGILGSGTSSAQAASDSIMEVSGLMSLGVYLFVACGAPIFLVLGMMLIDSDNHKAKRFLYAGIISAAMFFLGLALLYITVMSEPEFDRIYDQVVQERSAIVWYNGKSDIDTRWLTYDQSR